MQFEVQKKFQSTKTYTHAQGFSTAFRQWRATSHCNLIHGYALSIKLTFEGDLDERNWVQDFGGLKKVKEWLTEMFDHTCVVAKDDPHLETFRNLDAIRLIDLRIVDATGCEAFASLIFDALISKFELYDLKSVEVREHEGNSAICYKA